jgi:hypothetical protein
VEQIGEKYPKKWAIRICAFVLPFVWGSDTGWRKRS